MIIAGDQVNLRDLQDTDRDDYLRWFSPGCSWQKWDGPWERYGDWSGRSMANVESSLSAEPPSPRKRLEIETTSGVHIGWVNSYWINEISRWRDCGIVIAEAMWGRGLGSEAFALWINYQLTAFDLPRIGMGTWSGNKRMINTAANIGLLEEASFKSAREVEGVRYDAVRWGITREAWESYRTDSADRFRPFRPADREAVISLTQQLYAYHSELQQAAEYTEKDARESVLTWLGRSGQFAWVWQENGKVVGFARARYSGVYFMEELVIDRSCRGQGLGQRFLTAIEDSLRETGETDIFLSMVWPGNKRAIDCYCRWGYDLINTFELRKGLVADRRGCKIPFLGRTFHLTRSVPDPEPTSDPASESVPDPESIPDTDPIK